MNPKTILTASLLTAMLCCAGAADAGVSIENKHLTVKWTGPEGRVSVAAGATGKVFLKNVRLSADGGSATVTNVEHQVFGRGQALVVSYPGGQHDVVMLFDALPFALFRSSLHNGGSEGTIAKEVRPFAGAVDLPGGADQLKTFGTGGLLSADKNPGSYAWLAVVEPKSRHGAVLGWLTHERGSGVLFTRQAENTVRVEAAVQYGCLRLAPGASEELETLAVGCFDDARLGLEQWADAAARIHRVHLPPQPSGYCTWYSQPNGGASDERHVAELASFSATNLAPYGFSVVQIDDKWQDGVSTNGPKRVFTRVRPDGPYPGGMKAAADNIKSLGLVPGIWFMPFAGTYYDPFFKDHSDWFVKREDGRPYETAWGGTCLDMTNPGAREHLREVVRRITGEWGYQYIKIDGLWTGTATRQQYVNSGYKDDNMGDAVFQDPDQTNIEAYRRGLRLVREAAGSNVFILGCNGPQNMRSYGGAFGLVDAMRIGPDNGADWKRLTRGPVFGSRHYFLHGRLWYNDPDPVYVRASVPLHHAQLICSWVALSGQLNLSSEWLPGLPPERLDILRRTLPGHGLLPRPADLFENDPPRLWLLTDSRRSVRRDVIGVFNWESKEQIIDCALDHLGLEGGAEYVGFDYWQNKLVPSIKGRLQIAVPAESCRIIAVRPRAKHPQLLSSSRHVTQGIVDVIDEKWDVARRTLGGRSRLVGGDPYELRILADKAPTAVTLSAEDQSAGVQASLKQDGALVRVTIQSPANRDVSWKVQFK